MTQVAELPLPAAPRAAETRFVYSICFAHFVSHYFMLLLAPLFIFIKDDFGVSYTELGLALTVFNIVSTVGQTPVGFLVDRWNARYMLVAGLLVGSAALAVAGLVNSFWMFVAMFAVLGLGNTVYHPADYALLGRHVPVERTGRVFSYHTFSGMLGNAAAPATLVYLYAIMGWRGAFMCAAVLGVVAAVDRVPDPRAAGGGEARQEDNEEPAAPQPTAGSSCSRRRSSPIWCSSSCSRCRAAASTTIWWRRSARCTARRRRSPIPR